MFIAKKKEASADVYELYDTSGATKAIDLDGKEIAVRQFMGLASRARLEAQIAELQAKLAAIKAEEEKEKV